MKKSMVLINALVSMLLVASCVPSSQLVGIDGGIGGTGVQQWEGGIGGTGIVGTITGFGSIIVGGVHVQYDEATPVASMMGAEESANLKIGQVVNVEAYGKNGKLVARRIEIRHVLTGVVNEVNVAQGVLRVMGQTVRITDRNLFNAAVQHSTVRLTTVRPGDTIMVSGLRNGDIVEATRFDMAPRSNMAGVSGTVTKVGKGFVEVDGVGVSISSSRASLLSVGRVVSVQGRAEGNRINALTGIVELADEKPFGGRVKNLIVEGYPSRAPGGRANLFGMAITPDVAIHNSRVLAYGRQLNQGNYEVLGLSTLNSKNLRERPQFPQSVLGTPNANRGSLRSGGREGNSSRGGGRGGSSSGGRR